MVICPHPLEPSLVAVGCDRTGFSSRFYGFHKYLAVITFRATCSSQREPIFTKIYFFRIRVEGLCSLELTLHFHKDGQKALTVCCQENYTDDTDMQSLL